MEKGTQKGTGNSAEDSTRVLGNGGDTGAVWSSYSLSSATSTQNELLWEDTAVQVLGCGECLVSRAEAGMGRG